MKNKGNDIKFLIIFVTYSILVIVGTLIFYTYCEFKDNDSLFIKFEWIIKVLCIGIALLFFGYLIFRNIDILIHYKKYNENIKNKDYFNAYLLAKKYAQKYPKYYNYCWAMGACLIKEYNEFYYVYNSFHFSKKHYNILKAYDVYIRYIKTNKLFPQEIEMVIRKNEGYKDIQTALRILEFFYLKEYERVKQIIGQLRNTTHGALLEIVVTEISSRMEI